MIIISGLLCERRYNDCKNEHADKHKALEHILDYACKFFWRQFVPADETGQFRFGQFLLHFDVFVDAPNKRSLALSQFLPINAHRRCKNDNDDSGHCKDEI